MASNAKRKAETSHHKRPRASPSTKFSGITASIFPHVMEAITAAASFKLLLALRATCTTMKELADRRLAKHVVLKDGQFCHPKGESHSRPARLPFMLAARTEDNYNHHWRSWVRLLDLEGNDASIWSSVGIENVTLRGMTGVRAIRLRQPTQLPAALKKLVRGSTLVVFPAAYSLFLPRDRWGKFLPRDWYDLSKVPKTAAKVVVHLSTKDARCFHQQFTSICAAPRVVAVFADGEDLLERSFSVRISATTEFLIDAFVQNAQARKGKVQLTIVTCRGTSRDICREGREMITSYLKEALPNKYIERISTTRVLTPEEYCTTLSAEDYDLEMNSNYYLA